MSVHELPVDEEARLQLAVDTARNDTERIWANLALTRFIIDGIEAMQATWRAPEPPPAKVLQFRPRA